MSPWEIGVGDDAAGLPRESWEDDLWGELRDDDDGEWARDAIGYDYDDGLDD